MVSEYFSEFIASFVFLVLVILSVYYFSDSPGYIIALLISIALFIGIIIGQALHGPGYCNPLVAILLGVQGKKSGEYIAGMIGVEFIAAIVVTLAYLALTRPNMVTSAV